MTLKLNQPVRSEDFEATRRDRDFRCSDKTCYCHDVPKEDQ